MHRILRGLAAGTATLALALPALAANAAGEALAPVSVTLENACDTPLSVQLGALSVDVAPKTTTDPQTLAGSEKQAYDLKFTGASPADLGLLGMVPGGSYHVRFEKCRAGAADVITQDKSPRPETVSPQAAAQVRFRALNRGRAVEYKSGKAGRFKKLAVGYTSYEEQAAGEFEFTIRLRGKPGGPVMGMSKQAVQVAPGHKYLVETNIVGREILYKFEDEGWVGKDGK